MEHQFVRNHPEPDTRPLLWVDAVCINQNDGLEKAAQVMMMQDIYQKAERVVVWLGEEDAQSNKGLDFVSQLLAAEERAKTVLSDADASLVAWKRLRKLDLPKEGGDDDEYMSFISLFKRDWWSRVWIIQEVAMAKEAHLMCGSRSVLWDDFVKAFYFMNTLNLIIPDPARYAEVLFRVVSVIDARDSRVLGHERDLLGLLLRCRSSLATDPLDKVFALLGLATNTGEDGIKIRPEYGIEVKKVYTDLALAIIEHEGNLDILGVPRTKANPKEEPKAVQSVDSEKDQEANPTMDPFPSWVPDWSTWDSTLTLNRRERLASYEPQNEILIRKATGNTRAEPLRHANTNLLGLQGYTIDEITQLGPLYRSEDELLNFNIWLVDSIKFWKSNMQTLLHWESLSESNNQQHHYKNKIYRTTGESMLDAYWQTLTVGWQLNEEHTLSATTYREWDRYHRPAAWLRRFVGPKIATSSAYTWFTFALMFCKQMRRPPPELGFERPLSLASNRRFVRTGKGYMGLVGAETRVGDCVVLCKRGGSPLIMRPNGGSWELVGDSYVHGMMSGEVFEEEKCRTMWLA
ncbi:hypothetical protein N0V83_010665 [Neocucurbitaria cava]|uniref:Heterokaryon incompatibility domain-containing protein n=1 Tax=Neocucurbitaria cava TaxID=798079 RepID=A0A9W8XZ01_9PLEO|nr:hypothetical protein N0V83_010665 [Neocucurbitaria cava]